MPDVTREPIYRLRTPGSRIVGWGFIAFSAILTLVIIIDGGLGDIVTGIGFIIGFAAYGVLMYLIPHVETDARGVKTVGPFTTTFLPWTELAGVRTEWGLKLARIGGKEYAVHAYPSTGAFRGRKDKDQSPEFYTQGDYTMYLSKRPAISLIADQLHYYRETKMGARRLIKAAFARKVHYDRIVIATIATAAFLANIYVIVA